MRLVIQRAKSGKVIVDDNVVGKINYGFVVFVGIKKGDTPKNVKLLAEKLLNLRVMPDEKNKMNFSIKDINGEILVVSQFTLYADTKGRRPGFSQAAEPKFAKKLFDFFIKELKKSDLKIETGKFGAEMLVEIQNDGPVTIILEN